MSRSLIKNRLITSFLFFTVFLGSAFAWATKYRFQLNYDARYGLHTFGPPNVATNRQGLDFEQTAEYNKRWSSVLGLRTTLEGAYASLPDRYGVGDVARYDTQSILPRDNFVQYQNGSLRSRFGYQQVVWGEAFGSYYADIVNPKDMREGGLGDLSRNRIAIPMANFQWIYSSSSYQFLYIPKSTPSLVPKFGSDFNTFKLPGTLSTTPVFISRIPSSEPTRGEFGLRATRQFSSYDFSIFYLNYNDRMAVYQLDTSLVPTSAAATPDYKPLQTAGMTMTDDVNGYLIRAEILQHFNRELNTVVGSTLDSAKTNEFIYVLGVDLPQFDKCIISFQYSENRIRTDNWAFRQSFQSTAAARVSKTFHNEVVLDLTSSYITSDPSSLVTASVNVPLTSQTEFIMGLDRFYGSDTSKLGQLKNASRGWIMLKATLKQ